MSRVLAFDFGASTGRAILAEYSKASGLKCTEIHRFDNKTVTKDGSLRWDYDYLLGEVKKAIALADNIDSIAFDTWGVDYGLLDSEGKLIEQPICYRDERTSGISEKIFKTISPAELYKKTGNQIMEINTLFQLAAEKITNAKTLLFMPDLFAYSLCGTKSAEMTIASTSQMFSPSEKSWCKDIAALTGKNPDMLPEIAESATVAGEYNGIKIIKAAGHDTQCAVCAMPCEKDSTPAFLSCGTWSLLGCETDEPILTEKSIADNLSNEMGANGKINYLMNICGLWLIQEIRRNFIEEGKEYSYNDMEQLARACEPFCCFIDPDEPCLSLPGNIPQKIRNFCKDSGQPIPNSDGALVRCIYESLAMKYRFALEKISANTKKQFDVLHILGGGTKDSFLCQMTADSLDMPVVAGPAEATAMGNILLQLKALGDIGSIDEGRELIKANEKTIKYCPQNAQAFCRAYDKFKQAIQK